MRSGPVPRLHPCVWSGGGGGRVLTLAAAVLRMRGSARRGAPPPCPPFRQAAFPCVVPPSPARTLHLHTTTPVFLFLCTPSPPPTPGAHHPPFPSLPFPCRAHVRSNPGKRIVSHMKYIMWTNSEGRGYNNMAIFNAMYANRTSAFWQQFGPAIVDNFFTRSLLGEQVRRMEEACNADARHVCL